MKEYIERNALIAELEHDLENDINMYNSHTEKEIRDDKICFACDVLASASVADVKEIIYAEWVEKVKYAYMNHPVYYKECSNCGYKPSFHSNYCPECGATMDGIVKLERPKDPHDCSYCKHYKNCDHEDRHLRKMNKRDGREDCWERK